jgi:hypothetical protein
MWYDWAVFMFPYQQVMQQRAGQITAIIGIDKVNCNRSAKVRGHPLRSDTDYAVVRLFDKEPLLNFRESLNEGQWYTYGVKWGRLEDGFYLLPLDSIVGLTIVVPNIRADEDNATPCPFPL